MPKPTLLTLALRKRRLPSSLIPTVEIDGVAYAAAEDGATVGDAHSALAEIGYDVPLILPDGKRLANTTEWLEWLPGAFDRLFVDGLKVLASWLQKPKEVSIEPSSVPRLKPPKRGRRKHDDISETLPERLLRLARALPAEIRDLTHKEAALYLDVAARNEGITSVFTPEQDVSPDAKRALSAAKQEQPPGDDPQKAE